MPASKARRFRNTFLKTIILLAAAGALAAGLWILFGDEIRGQRIEVLEDRVRALRRLVTVTQIYRDVIYTEQRRFFVAEKRLLFTVEYTVEAGVDFSQGLEIHHGPGGELIVEMPPPRILAVDADDTTIQQIFVTERFDRVRLSDYMPRILSGAENIRQASLESGILDIAENNAKLAVLRVLELSGMKSVRFIALPANNTEVPDGS